MNNRVKLILSLALLIKSATLTAFEYQIEEIFLEGFSIPAHETITSMAIDCLIRYGSDEPKDCLHYATTIGQLNDKTPVDIPSIPDLNAREILDASSFPDDPTRISDGLTKGAKGYVNSKNKCDIPVWWKVWTKTTKNFHHDITGGLFCNSHFGVLQFWHSMASEPQPITENSERVFDENGEEVRGPPESYENTMAKILAWAKLTYDISVDEDHIILNRNYCDYFKELMTSKDTFSREMAYAFYPDDAILHNPPLYLCNKEEGYDDYKVRWIFKHECNGLSGEKCDTYGTERDWQIAALGSLLHLIQDSYSQSHTLRGSCDLSDPNTISRIDCSVISGFLSYSTQSSDKHKEADIFPLSIAKNCSDENIDDVVTASAKALWYVQQGNKYGFSNFLTYLKKSVFKSPYKPGEKGPHASPGDCFKKE